jgi:putative transposase
VARLPRFSTPGRPQHVIQRGNNKSRVFVSDADFLVMKAFLMSAGESGDIGRVMQAVSGRYAQYFNNKYRRTGSLWEGRYRGTVIDTDRYLFTCLRYIEENPVRAGLANHPDEYPWSSYAANALGMNDSIVTPHERYVTLADSPRTRQAAYRALFRRPLDLPILAEIRDATHFGWALGVKEIGPDRRPARVRAPRRRPA